MRSALIVDLDGTLASCAWRRSLVTGPREGRDWITFHTLASCDRPNPRVMIAIGLARLAGLTVVATSARPHWARRRTEFWLAEWGVEVDELLMRPAAGPWRNDAEFKHVTLHELILPRWSVVGAYDDRPPVVEVWRQHGIPTVEVEDPGLLPRIGGGP